ncbi:MAG: hypothetical protein PVI01_02155 [Gemmatimonadales bacterium]|jgi:anti-sigma-K factor RskA
MATDCDKALERLLEADPAELAGRGDSELASHVRECDRCAAVGARLLAGQEPLAAELTEWRPRTDVGSALRAVHARRGRTLHWERVWRWAPVAAAAALAAAMVLQALPSRMVEGGRVPAVAEVEPLLEAPSGENVLVFETRDGSTKVIWFY